MFAIPFRTKTFLQLNISLVVVAVAVVALNTLHKPLKKKKEKKNTTEMTKKGLDLINIL